MLTATDLAAIEQARDAYADARARRLNPSIITRRRRDLETLLVRHVDELLAAARARLPGVAMEPQERWVREVGR